MKENQQPITGCGAGDTAPYVFLCGDPERIPKVTESWSDVREVCRIREYLIHTGVYDGVEMTAASTGVGGPSTAVVMEELVKLGGHTFIRVGNSGALADEVALGDYVITTGSIRDEGTSKSYVRDEYPASAHFEVTAALVRAAQADRARHHVGRKGTVLAHAHGLGLRLLEGPQEGRVASTRGVAEFQTTLCSDTQLHEGVLHPVG